MVISELFKVLGDDNRIRILNMLQQEALCVCELEVILGISQSNASRHLNKLRSMGIIKAEKKAQWVFYEMDGQFKEQYPSLYEFLKIETKKNKVCEIDTHKLIKYKSSAYTCEQIGQEQAQVIKFLNITH